MSFSYFLFFGFKSSFLVFSVKGYCLMIRIALSPCPNDMFSFFALMSEKISFRVPLSFDLKPLHELNEALFQVKPYDFIKASSAAYLECQDKYDSCLLGNSFAFEKGPVVFARKPYGENELKDLSFSVPGKKTAAYKLLKEMIDPSEVQFKAFYEIIPSLQKGETEAGIVIHEGRTKASDYGLYEICDLASLWSAKYGVPVPLGVFLSRKDLEPSLAKDFMGILQESIEYAKNHFDEALEFCKKFSQEKDEVSLRKHIENFALGQDEIPENLQKKSIKIFRGGL